MEENEGSFPIGFLLGFFLGCIGVVIAFLMQGSKTSTGSIVGVLIQVLLWLCMGFSVTVLQIVLTNM